MHARLYVYIHLYYTKCMYIHACACDLLILTINSYLLAKKKGKKVSVSLLGTYSRYYSVVWRVEGGVWRNTLWRSDLTTYMHLQNVICVSVKTRRVGLDQCIPLFSLPCLWFVIIFLCHPIMFSTRRNLTEPANNKWY